jgi:hypothetical protein
MKTQFTSHGRDGCSVRYFDELADRDVTRTFIRSGREVHELLGHESRPRQVCERLSWLGPTLLIAKDCDLIDMIRWEWKKARAADASRKRKEARQW